MKTIIDIFCFKKNELYGSELPRNIEDLNKINKLGIKIIVSLEEEIKQTREKTPLTTLFEHYELFIPDYMKPTNEQVEKFLQILSKARKRKKPVLVHCLAGCGRTGIMLALAERFVYGTLNGKQAIDNLRKIRPCAVETSEQQAFIINYTRS